MSLIQPLKFRTWETGYFKMPRFEMPRFEMPRLQTAVFQMMVTVASGLCRHFLFESQDLQIIPTTL